MRKRSKRCVALDLQSLLGSVNALVTLRGLLAVLEVYSEWCGPCKSVLPTLKRIKLDKDDESTLQFLTVCA